MPVFISYHRPDEQVALEIDMVLKANSVHTYLDVRDAHLSSGENVTKAILTGLDRCSHLLAVITGSTRLSWWVPFEIGVATKADRRIVSFERSSEPLPDYLRTWPVLRTGSDLHKFVIRYKQDTSTSLLERLGRSAGGQDIGSARDFHELLKRDLS